jgi:GNAT superfamily N-acetyltransferase
VIREPRTSDLGDLLELMRKMHVETRFSAFSLSEERVLDGLSGFLNPENGYFGQVLEVGGRVCGVFFGHCGQLWFSEELCGFDDLLYVEPEARGSGAARMLRRFEAWCRKKGCSAVLVGVSSGVMVGRTGALLEKLGYGHLGGLYRRHF